MVVVTPLEFYYLKKINCRFTQRIGKISLMRYCIWTEKTGMMELPQREIK